MILFKLLWVEVFIDKVDSLLSHIKEAFEGYCIESKYFYGLTAQVGKIMS